MPNTTPKLGAFASLLAYNPPYTTFILLGLERFEHALPASGVYMVHRGVAQFPRRLEAALRLPIEDPLGVLYVGASCQLWHRVADFTRSLRPMMKSSRHPAASMLRSLVEAGDSNLEALLSVHIFEADDPEDLEGRFINAFLEQYGCLPPLNFVTRHHRPFNRLWTP